MSNSSQFFERKTEKYLAGFEKYGYIMYNQYTAVAAYAALVRYYGYLHKPVSVSRTCRPWRLSISLKTRDRLTACP
jgi:hypothetical protein